MTVNVEFGAVCHGKIEFAARDFLHEVSNLEVSVFRPFEFRIDLAQKREHVGVTATRSYLNRPADYLLDRAGLTRAEFVDEVHVDGVVRMAEIQVLAARLGNRKSCRSHVRFACDQVRQDFRNTVNGLDDQFYAKVVGKSSHQIEFGPG